MVYKSLLKKTDCFNSGADNVTGSAEGYLYDTITYSSSVDNIDNLAALIRYDIGYTNLPVSILMHGWNSDYTAFSEVTVNRFASYKSLVIVPGMRGRNGADSSRDASAMEIYDIYDAVQYVIDSFADIIDSTKITIIGYSGGGGNVLAACCKFPDFWNLAVDYFGISDYGYNETYGWYQQEPGRRSAIVNSIGCEPASCRDNYRSRNTVEAINNYKSPLYIFHDPDDYNVEVSHSRRINEERTICTFYYEDTLYTHAFPAGNPNLITSEALYSSRITTNNRIAIPNTGNYRIIGYLKTIPFEIRLGNRDDEVAQLAYNLMDTIFTVTPLTGAMDVNIIIGDIDSTTNINTQTIFDL
ncbi:prolyl oligopeptidase family serine peptidase [Candidatus Pacearchaeota archaeon]|nr:prolyl oligopeptidase family serine peptidase [Candidatus Pacearchaeota archaeon]